MLLRKATENGFVHEGKRLKVTVHVTRVSI